MNLYKKTVETFGEEAQIDELVEHSAALIIGINQFKKGTKNLSELMIDVAKLSISLKQIPYLFNNVENKYMNATYIEEQKAWERLNEF